ncbi:hypothetical protein L249_3398, partial [Ophiocordyceps polyrhachis-furcata BCC 54312]
MGRSNIIKSMTPGGAPIWQRREEEEEEKASSWVNNMLSSTCRQLHGPPRGLGLVVDSSPTQLYTRPPLLEASTPSASPLALLPSPPRKRILLLSHHVHYDGWALARSAVHFRNLRRKMHTASTLHTTYHLLTAG